MPEIRATIRSLFGGSRALRLAIISIFVLSGLARGFLVATATPQLISDAADYDILARNLLAGEGYVQTSTIRENPAATPVYEGFTFRAFRAPGYPLFLTVVYGIAGWKPSLALAANAVTDLVTQCCFLLIAYRLLGHWSAVFVQLLVGCHALWTPLAMTESLFTALFALTALVLVFDIPARSAKGALLCGGVVCAALFTRPIAVCVFPVLFWKLLRGREGRRRPGLLLLVVSPSIVMLAVWGARNYRLFGEVVLLTTNLGPHNADDFGLGHNRMFLELRYRGLNEAQINKQFLLTEWYAVLADPWKIAVLWSRRVIDLFSPYPAWEVRELLWKRTFDAGPRAQFVGRMFRAAYYQYYATYALAAGGVCILAARRQRLCGLWSLALCYVVIHAAVSRGDIRLAAPLYPIMCLFAAACGPTLWTLRKRTTGAEAEGSLDS